MTNMHSFSGHHSVDISLDHGQSAEWQAVDRQQQWHPLFKVPGVQALCLPPTPECNHQESRESLLFPTFPQYPGQCLIYSKQELKPTVLATVRDLSMRKTLTSLLHCLPRQIPAKWHSPTTAHLSSHRGPRAVGKLCPAGDLCPTAPVNRGNDNRVHVQPAIPECSFMVRSHLTATILVYTAIFSSQAAEGRLPLWGRHCTPIYRPWLRPGTSRVTAVSTAGTGDNGFSTKVFQA
ncbi:uncharacterized protein LOC116662702 isoform X2 [Camelus ferus]|uniref:Uncharacterized protein LOC116662702 isoform X2 n=1 Tax=Camelus ferus TaxID=419612 RepID=A0A8B8SQY4_CAMFR|nr:uncharacterized protein LOC116662702 isoform X2 [Camelus ferus]